MEKFSWGKLELYPGMAPANSASSSLNNLESLSPIDLITREPFQNSKDERLPEKKLRYSLRLHKLVGEQKNRFLELMDVGEIMRISELFDDRENYFEDGRNEIKLVQTPDYELNILEIYDSASGLGGDWSKPGDNSNFYNLVLSLYNSKKSTAESPTLGSYGVGKMIFALASKLRFMMYYSHFPETQKPTRSWARFMATGFFNQFEENDINYSGHAYFGAATDLPQHKRAPIENEEADKFVKALGLPVRQKNDFGTSVFVPFATADDIETLKKSFEKWWWPVIEGPDYDESYDIEFVDTDGTRITPTPSKNPELRPLIKAYKNLVSNVAPDDGALEKLKVKKHNKMEFAGTLSLLRTPATADNQNLLNKIALVRGGMVIKYDAKGLDGELEPACSAVFQATDDRIYKLSEPEAHDNWLPNQQRLHRIEGEEAGKFLNRVLKQIETKSSDFKARQREIKKPKEHNPLRFLDDALMPLLKSQKTGKPIGPEAGPRAPIIRKKGYREKVDGRAYDHLNFELSIHEDHNLETSDYIVKITLHSAEGSSGTKMGEKLSFVAQSDDFTVEQQTDGSFNVELTRGKFLRGSAKAKVNPNWITKWTVQLQPSEGAEK